MYFLCKMLLIRNKFMHHSPATNQDLELYFCLNYELHKIRLWLPVNRLKIYSHIPIDVPLAVYRSIFLSSRAGLFLIVTHQQKLFDKVDLTSLIIPSKLPPTLISISVYCLQIKLLPVMFHFHHHEVSDIAIQEALSRVAGSCLII